MAKKPLKRIIAFLICIVLTFVSAAPIAVNAEEEDKTVRVGWYESTFNQTDEFSRRSGYAYEYQQKIAAYTGWHYEYVEGSWPELLQMLIDGKIDLMSDVSYTDERSELMLFSELPMGSEEYFVFVSQDSKSGISADDLSSFNGKHIGVNKGSLQESLFKSWAEAKNIRAEIIELSTSEDESVAMLNRGEFDAYVSIHALGSYHNMAPVCKIGSSDFFFAVNKARPELLSDLDFAMNRIQDDNFYYIRNLYNKYIGYSGSEQFLTPNELNWLAEHGTIRVGYRDDYLAFCAKDPETGELTGALKSFLDIASNSIKNAEIKFEAVPFHTPEEALNALTAGEMDCLFPTNISDYDSENLHLSLTVPLMQSGLIAIIRQSAQRDFSLQGNVRVAINEGNPDYETVLMNCFPTWERVYFKDTDECLAAVSNDKADCVLTSNYRAGIISDTIEKYKLTTVNTGETISFSLAVKHEDSTLYGILNKVTNLVPSSAVNAALAAYSSAEPKITFVSFLSQNLVPVLTIVSIVFAFIILLLLRSITSENEAKTTMQQIEELSDKQKNQLKEISKLNKELSASQQDLKEALAAAEQANRAKTSFLANMSHGIRTPLNAIIGIDNIALNDTDLKPQTKEQLEKIGSSAKHLLGIINDILDMSSIESGHMELKDEKFSFSEFIEQINVIISSQCSDKKLDYDCKIIGTAEDYYVGDAMKLKQVLINILDNAVKFTPAPGSVRFTAEQTAVLDNSRTLRFIISDTSVGMSKEYISKVFEKFSQETEGSINTYGGTGLGLAITEKIVAMMNGDITVDSEKGKGSVITVTVTLKAADNETGASPVSDKTESPAAALEGRLILIAEDMDINAEILMDLLNIENIRTERAENGQVAVNMFKEHPAGTYDAILMDVRMPVMDGLEATRAIRALDRPDAKQIPIIAMTANAFTDDVQQSIQAGMTAHLSKPVEPDVLYETLCRMIQKNGD